MKRDKDMWTARGKGQWVAAAGMLVLLGAANLAKAQTPLPDFNSGSTGDDGDFILSGPSGTVIEFDPARITRVNGKDAGNIDPEHDNIFHFKTITIPTGVTLKMSAKWTNGPVYLLAQRGVASGSGAVTIAGDLNLEGENGSGDTKTTSLRRQAIAGPGGFPGGLGGRTSAPSPDPATLPTAGLGPGGGRPSRLQGWTTHTGEGGKSTVSRFLVPLIGGSGGGGSDYDLPFEWWGSGGGAGGGAILISSSVSITVSGRIFAGGGTGGRWRQNANCPAGGAGAGGSIRLVAPTLLGAGTLYVNNGGDNNCWTTPGPSGQNGRVRLEAFQHSWTFFIPYGSYSSGSPIKSFVPSAPPASVVVTHVAGTALPNPKGEFTPADITINASGAVEIKVTARGVPLTVPDPETGLSKNMKVTLHVFSLDSLEGQGSDQIIESTDLVLNLPESTPTFTVSTATITVKLPPGFTRAFVRAKW